MLLGDYKKESIFDMIYLVKQMWTKPLCVQESQMLDASKVSKAAKVSGLELRLNCTISS